MRIEKRWLLAALVGLGVGSVCAAPYARLAAPFYSTVAQLVALALGRPWQVSSVDVRPDKAGRGDELQLRAEVRRPPDTRVRAQVVGRVQVGEVVEGPVVFWTLLLAWPAPSSRLRLRRALYAVPIFLCVEATTTAAQLILPMAQASAILAGDSNPVTPWDRWSRFLEAGGQFVLICAAALAAISCTRRCDARP